MFLLKKRNATNKRHETIGTIISWQEQAFPDATLAKQLEKYADERDEFCAAIKKKDRIAELADLFIVACNISRFNSIAAMSAFEDIDFLTRANNVSEYALQKAIDKKMEINRRRKWNFLGGKYQHSGE